MFVFRVWPSGPRLWGWEVGYRSEINPQIVLNQISGIELTRAEAEDQAYAFIVAEKARIEGDKVRYGTPWTELVPQSER